MVLILILNCQDFVENTTQSFAVQNTFELMRSVYVKKQPNVVLVNINDNFILV